MLTEEMFEAVALQIPITAALQSKYYLLLSGDRNNTPFGSAPAAQRIFTTVLQDVFTRMKMHPAPPAKLYSIPLASELSRRPITHHITPDITRRLISYLPFLSLPPAYPKFTPFFHSHRLILQSFLPFTPDYKRKFSALESIFPTHHSSTPTTPQPLSSTLILKAAQHLLFSLPLSILIFPTPAVYTHLSVDTVGASFRQQHALPPYTTSDNLVILHPIVSPARCPLHYLCLRFRCVG